MKKLIQKFLSLFGIRIIRAKYARKYLAKPTIDNIEVVLRLLQQTGKQSVILQVGACDGVTSDSIHPYVKAGSVKAFLVEPSSLNFSKLKQFYAGTPNVTLIQAAVSDHDGSQSFYTIRDEGRWKDSGWARQLASFYKPHLLRHGIREEEIASEEVRCLMLSSLVKEYGIQHLDILQIDTEGFDGEIVKMALAQGVCPTFIIFENAQLVQNWTQAQLDDLYQRLAQHGYGWTHDRINTMAVLTSFFPAHEPGKHVPHNPES